MTQAVRRQPALLETCLPPPAAHAGSGLHCCGRCTAGRCTADIARRNRRIAHCPPAHRTELRGRNVTPPHGRGAVDERFLRCFYPFGMVASEGSASSSFYRLCHHRYYYPYAVRICSSIPLTACGAKSAPLCFLRVLLSAPRSCPANCCGASPHRFLLAKTAAWRPSAGRAARRPVAVSPV